MKRSTYMNYSKKDLERLDEKERRLAILKKYYGRYGERILSIMMQHSSTEQGLNNLLSRLEIRVMEDGDEAIHSEISKWISVYGERRFLEMYKTEAGKQQSAYAIKPLGPAESLSQPVAPTEPPASPSHPSTAPTGHVPPQAQTPSRMLKTRRLRQNHPLLRRWMQLSRNLLRNPKKPGQKLSGEAARNAASTRIGARTLN
ncbi:MAG TPA: hypothetical protein P5245_07330 [Candidatus Sumerlaeia bacterium]|nr:hypothetical protein [Candidatus Sumerlaeia bacterium]